MRTTKTSDRGLARLVIGLFGVVLGLVGLVFVILLVSVTQQRSGLQSGRQTTDVLTSSSAAEVALLTADTAVRGFRLTGEQRYLWPYVVAVRELRAELAKLERLARSADERRRVAAIAAATRRYLTEYGKSEITRVEPRSRPEEARAVRRGKTLVDALRGQFQTLNDAEQAARIRRRAMLRAGSDRTIVIASGGLAAFTILLLALAAYVVTRILRPMRQVADAAEQLARGDLDVRVQRIGRGEVRGLAQSFNAMATALQAREAELSAANSELERAVGAAEQASRMKSSFLANMSHEIRTPLSGVVGMTSLLASTKLTKEQREYVKTARASSETLMNVVSDILDVSKIEAGRMEVEQRDFDLHELVATDCAMLAEQAHAKGVALRMTLHDDVPRAVRGDRLRVGQILANLLSNAVKFTGDGEIDVEVSVAERRDDAIVVRFEVRDTGIGVDPVRLSRLFDPFTQADISTTRQYGGTGLGLTICRDLTRLMGGTIEAQSEPGRGSTFRFEIPFAPATAEPLPRAASAELGGLRVLVATGEPVAGRAIEGWLQSRGMRPSSARDVDDAYDQLLAAAADGEPFQVALLDLDTAAAGRPLPQRIAASPRLRATRLVLLVSPGAPPAHREIAQLVKPVGETQLLEAVEAAMGGPLPAHAAGSAQAPAPRADPPAAAPAPSGAPRARSRVLAVEDNGANRLYIDRLLAKCGHDVSLAVDGRDALRLYEAEAFDLILMDCQMPELDGYEVTAEIRRREWDEGRERMPIVAMTAGALGGARDDCLRAGMDDYLSKPFDERDLVAILDRWLAPAADGVEILDPARIAELRELFPGEMASSMWSELIETMSTDLDRIARAVADDEPAAIAAATHRIRGTASMLGATALIAAATKLQADAQRAAAGGLPVGHGAVAAIHLRWVEVMRAIDAQPDAPGRFAAAATSDSEGDRSGH